MEPWGFGLRWATRTKAKMRSHCPALHPNTLIWIKVAEFIDPKCLFLIGFDQLATAAPLPLLTDPRFGQHRSLECSDYV